MRTQTKAIILQEFEQINHVCLFAEVNFDLLLEDMSETVLTEAIKGGDLRIIEMIIEAGAKPTSRNFSGKGPLHLAAFIGNSRVVTTLLANGAPVDTTDNSGRSALHWAARKHEHTTEMLLKKGADVNIANKDGESYNTCYH